MHQHSFDINIENLSKIEGHADLYIKVRKGEVLDAKLKIVENKRFYTQAIRGKMFNSVPQLVSRICGTCSVAHLSCCTEAVENALDFKPSDQTRALRHLNMYGLMIRDHALHLYIFVLPDIFGVQSVMELADKDEDLVRQAFIVKGAGNRLCKLVGGRAIHPIFSGVGGFLKLPEKNGIKKSIEELYSVRAFATELIDILLESDFNFTRKSNYVGIANENYNFMRGEIMSSEGTCIPERHYWDHLNRVVIPYSQATGFRFEGKEYTVGALARMNLNRHNMHPDTLHDVPEAVAKFPSDNIYSNNLAQAVEMLHSIDNAIEIMETWDFKQEPRPVIKPKASEGVGVIEAPRGTLYYLLSFMEDGRIRYGNLVIPTAQNQIQMEKDIKAFVPELLSRDMERHDIEHEIEKLIRAYDPCMSCASHFLKVRWEDG
ncbi:MAG: nickel-dependent hydrogenase large subunit [Candidatus Aenigmarchaeota archaeon]|nr:nickel-dependent hydrogenase large subunit [Candidatus Aenigmarchaeota archaeon]